MDVHMLPSRRIVLTCKITGCSWLNSSCIWSNTIFLWTSSLDLFNSNMILINLHIIPKKHSTKTKNTYLKSNMILGLIDQSNSARALLLGFNCKEKSNTNSATISFPEFIQQNFHYKPTLSPPHTQKKKERKTKMKTMKSGCT